MHLSRQLEMWKVAMDAWVMSRPSTRIAGVDETTRNPEFATIPASFFLGRRRQDKKAGWLS